MAPSGIPKQAMYQDKVFFSSEWTRSMDRQFITILLQLKAEGLWQVGMKNTDACIRAIRVYNSISGTSFPDRYGIERTRKLHKRYKVFSWLIQRPWVLYDPTTHSVSCDDAVWNVLYDKQMLVAPYIREGEHSFVELQELFQVANSSVGDVEVIDVIQISSDTEDVTDYDSSVVEIPNPHRSSLSSTHETRENSLNTDNIYYNELTFLHSDSESEDSIGKAGRSIGMSTNSPSGDTNSKKGKGRVGGSGSNTRTGTSSCASWSPFKRH